MSKDISTKMADSVGFRVCVDASEMYEDIRSRFFIYVDLLRDRNIHDIENRIRTFLRADKPISLMIGSFYLPSSENVRLLGAGDVLKVVEQGRECCNDTDDSQYNKDEANVCQEVYLKEHKRSKKRKYSISGDVNDSSCTAVKENDYMSKVQKCETLPNSLDECTEAEYPKHKEKKRKKESEDNKSCMSDEQCITEKSGNEEELNGAQRLVEERKERRKRKRIGNNEDDIYNSCMNVERKSEQVETKSVDDIQCLVKEGKKIRKRKRERNEGVGDISNSLMSAEQVEIEESVRESGENDIFNSSEMGLSTETVEDNEKSGPKIRRKRIRRHKKKHEVGQSKTTGKFPASVVNPKRETLISSIAAPRTHIRFDDWDGDIKNNNTTDVKKETCDLTSWMECGTTGTSNVGVEDDGLQTVATPLSDAASLNVSGQEQKDLVSRERSSTKWDIQALDSSKSEDLLCNGGSFNSDTFGRLLANSSTPRVYQRKKSFVTTDKPANGSTPETSSNIDVEDGEQIKSGDKNTLNFANFPVVEGTPKQGDVIAFKMLKMGKDYTPQVSDYITAKVLSACNDSYQLTLKILDGHDECQQPKGKFDLENDSIPEMCIDDDLEVNWNELLETRLVFP